MRDITELEYLLKRANRVEIRYLYPPKQRKGSSRATSKVEVLGVISPERLLSLIEKLRVFRKMARAKMI